MLADFVAGEGLASFPGCRQAAGMFSALLTVDPLEEDIEQQVTAENAKCQEDRKRQANLTRTGVHDRSEQGQSRGGNPKKS